METMTKAPKAEVVDRDTNAQGVSIQRALNSTQVLSTRAWTDQNGNHHEAAATQTKQPVSVRYTVIRKSDGTSVEQVLIRFKKSNVTIRAFSGDVAHMLQPISKGSDIGHITATEMSYDARTQKFSTDEVEVEEPNEASA